MSDAFPFSERFARWTLRRRWPVFIIVLAFVGFASIGAFSLRIDESYRTLFGKSNPHWRTFEAIEKTYSRIDNAYLAIAPKDGDVFTPAAIQAIYALTDEAWQLPYATRVESITNYTFCRADGDDIYISDLVPDPAGLSVEDLHQIREAIFSDPSAVGRLVSADGRVAGINVSFILPESSLGGDWNRTAVQVRALAASIEERFPDVDVRITGFLMLNNAFRSAALWDLLVQMPLMYAAVAIVAFYFLRSARATVAAMSIVTLSSLTGFGIAGWLGYSLTGPSVTVGPLIMTLAIADTMHVLISIRAARAAGVETSEAIVQSIRANAGPEFYSCLTTTVCLLCLNFSQSAPLRDIGDITAIGVVSAFVYTLLFLPALVSLIGLESSRLQAREIRWPSVVANTVIAHRRAALSLVLCVVAFLGTMIPRNELDERVARYFDPQSEFRTDSEFIVEHMGGAYLMEFSLGTGEANGIADPGYLSSLDGFAEWLRGQDGVANVIVFSDIVKRLNMSMHGDDTGYHRIPDDRQLAAQYVLLFELSLPPGQDLGNIVDIDKSSSRVIVTTDVMSSNNLRALGEAASEWLRANAPGVQAAPASGSALLFAHLSEMNMREMAWGTLASLGLIAALMIISLRSFRFGLLSLIPNVVPSIAAFGIWGLCVGYISFALSTVTAMTLGIIVDDTIHFLKHYTNARRDLGLDPEAAVRHTFATVGRALLSTTVILCAGFAVLGMSSFSFNRDMALLSGIVIACAFVADVVLLPALLLTLDRKSVKQ